MNHSNADIFFNGARGTFHIDCVSQPKLKDASEAHELIGYLNAKVLRAAADGNRQEQLLRLSQIAATAARAAVQIVMPSITARWKKAKVQPAPKPLRKTSVKKGRTS